MSSTAPHGKPPHAKPLRAPVFRPAFARAFVLAGCLCLSAAACVEEQAAPAPAAVSERPTWKPPAPPPPPKSCGVGCLEGKGNAVVRFQMDGGEYTVSFSVEGNEGLFAIGTPINISENTTNWSGIRTFFNPEPGVYPLEIRATGEWTLSISKGKQSYADG